MVRSKVGILSVFLLASMDLLAVAKMGNQSDSLDYFYLSNLSTTVPLPSSPWSWNLRQGEMNNMKGNWICFRIRKKKV